MNFSSTTTKHDTYFWLMSLARLIFAVILGLYFWQAILHPKAWHLIDGANLAIHETGHLLAKFASPVIQMSAGTIAQLLAPTILILYFLIINKKYAAFIMMFWLGQSLANISVYMADAINMQLPLIGGPNSIHDWHWLLKHFDLLGKTDIISNNTWTIAVAIACLASLGSLFTVGKDDRDYF